MGCKVSKTGVSIQLVNSDGTPDGPPIYGRYAKLYGMSRKKVHSLDLTEDERDFMGSADWLTLVAVADTEEKLTELVNGSGVPTHHADTSGSSRRVQIELHVGSVRQSYTDRITIATGPLLQLTPSPIVHVNNVMVLPAGTRIGDLQAQDPKHSLVGEFKGNAPTATELNPPT